MTIQQHVTKAEQLVDAVIETSKLQAESLAHVAGAMSGFLAIARATTIDPEVLARVLAPVDRYLSALEQLRDQMITITAKLRADLAPVVS